jgi:hypothetical protein
VRELTSNGSSNAVDPARTAADESNSEYLVMPNGWTDSDGFNDG